MCTPDILNWTAQNLSPDEVAGRRVLDVGAYIVNGSLRLVIVPLNPAEYIGIDMRAGPGVDIVCRAEQLVEIFGPDSFDIVVSSSTLEHVRNWREVISNIKAICKPGGLIIVNMPSVWPFHAYPNDFWRYQIEDVEAIFADCDILLLEDDAKPWSTVYAKIKKAAHFMEQDLTDYQLHSVITGKRISTLHTRDFFRPYFGGVIWHHLIRPRLAFFLIYIKMGIKIRLLQPLGNFWLKKW
jgi:SAM-dependent methyltransferase